ncbi:MAG: MBL fold metallo-hydrolase [Burkholderiaceae bacterium]|nr:MBL fold metallo-hydrolase [Burkholderiaceae bacterium]
MKKSPEQAIRYADLPIPEIGQITPIAKGVYWVRMPLPFALDHINLWMLEDSLEGVKGWTVIDAGVGTEATRAAWRQVIQNHFQGLPIVRVLCTHYHPDHIGLAAWLGNGADTGRWTAPLWINYAEYQTARVFLGAGASIKLDEGAGAVNMASHFHRHGINDPDTIEKLRARSGHFPSLVPEVPDSFVRIFPNQSIRIGEHHWHVIAGYGHSPEHCALYCEDLNLLISGDMVLPKISTNMSVWPQEPDADPLKLYLDSLHAFELLPDDVLVLPSHGKPFGADPGSRAGGIKERITQLREHHRDRLDETREACREAKHACEVMPVLFKRQLDLHQLTFAMGETIAHLNHLWHAGVLKRVTQPDGSLKFLTV